WLRSGSIGISEPGGRCEMATKSKPKEKAVIDRAQALRAAVADADVIDATPEARARARKLLSENGDIWRASYEIADAALITFIEAMRSTGLTKELYKLECKRLKQELATEKDSPLEKLLVGQVVLAWVRLSVVEQEYTCILYGTELHSIERGLYWERRLSMSRKLLDQASTSPARVRRLLLGVRVKNPNVALINPAMASLPNPHNSQK